MYLDWKGLSWDWDFGPPPLRLPSSFLSLAPVAHSVQIHKGRLDEAALFQLPRSVQSMRLPCLLRKKWGYRVTSRPPREAVTTTNLLVHVVTLYALGNHTATAFPFSLRRGRRLRPFLFPLLLPSFFPCAADIARFVTTNSSSSVVNCNLSFLPSLLRCARSFVPSESNSAAAVPENWGPSRV